MEGRRETPAVDAAQSGQLTFGFCGRGRCEDRCLAGRVPGEAVHSVENIRRVNVAFLVHGDSVIDSGFGDHATHFPRECVHDGNLVDHADVQRVTLRDVEGNTAQVRPLIQILSIRIEDFDPVVGATGGV